MFDLLLRYMNQSVIQIAYSLEELEVKMNPRFLG
jgi:hypothetical protein